MTADREHREVMAELDRNAQRIIEMAARLAVLEAEVEVYRPPVVDEADAKSSL